MNKKAQGISINVIIVAAVALVVLVVLVAIFTGRIGRFSGGVEDTTGQDFGAQFGDDCHPSTTIASSYNSEVTRLEAEIAQAEAANTDASGSRAQLDQVKADYASIVRLCGDVQVQNNCVATTVTRGSLSGNCAWK